MLFKTVIKNIIDNMNHPRAQVERQISPFLDLFIVDIVNTTKHSANTCGEIYRLIASEFPLSTSENDKNSRSIDYLFVDQNNSRLLLLELKTDSKSFDADQCEFYNNLIKKIEDEKSGFLYNFICRLENKKFEFQRILIDNEIGNPKAWEQIRVAQTIYIAPSNMKNRGWGEKNRTLINGIEFLSFSDLLVSDKHKYVDEWAIIKPELIRLDKN